MAGPPWYYLHTSKFSTNGHIYSKGPKSSAQWTNKNDQKKRIENLAPRPSRMLSCDVSEGDNQWNSPLTVKHNSLLLGSGSVGIRLHYACLSLSAAFYTKALCLSCFPLSLCSPFPTATPERKSKNSFKDFIPVVLKSRTRSQTGKRGIYIETQQWGMGMATFVIGCSGVLGVNG